MWSCRGDVAMNELCQYLEIAVAEQLTGAEDCSMLLLLLTFLNKYNQPHAVVTL